MLSHLYRVDIDLAKNGNWVSQSSDYFDNMDEAIEYSKLVGDKVEEVYQEKYGKDNVIRDYGIENRLKAYSERNEIFFSISERIYLKHKYNKDFVNIDIVRKVDMNSRIPFDNIKNVVRDIEND